MKILNKIKSLIYVIVIFLFSITIVHGTPPLPSPPQNKIEAEKLILEAKNYVLQTEQLLSKAQDLDLKSENLFNKIFVKRIIWKMKNKINKTRIDITTAEDASLNEKFGVVSAITASSINKSSYIKVNLEKILEGKRLSNWSREDIIEIKTTTE